MYQKHSSAEIPCDNTVAQAAPAVPICSVAIKNISKTIFKNDDKMRKYKGVRLSPKERRILAAIL